MLAVEHLGTRLSERFRVDAVSFAVDRGERLAVIGPNGSGKSSLLRLVAGLLVPDHGTIAWSGTLLSSAGRLHVSPDDRSVGFVFQHGALFPHLDVRSNVAIGLDPGTSARAARAAVDEALSLSRVGLPSDASVGGLSGGELQRVALARALVRRPALLVLDEPFHSLDAPVSREIMTELRSLIDQAQMAAILVTHDIAEAAAFADRLLVLLDGRAVQCGPFREIYHRPADRAAAELLGPLETLDAAQARLVGVGLPAGSDQGPVHFRPEYVRLTRAMPDEPAVARVAQVRARGPLDEVTVVLRDDTELWSLQSAIPGRDSSPLSAGDAVAVRIAQRIDFASEGSGSS